MSGVADGPYHGPPKPSPRPALLQVAWVAQPLPVSLHNHTHTLRGNIRIAE